MSLVSVVIAFAVVASVVGPAALLLEKAVTLSTLTRSQLVAGNLAQSQLEVIRSEAGNSFAQLASNVGTTSATQQVGGTAYTVATDVFWSPGTTDPSGCSPGSSPQQSLNPVLSATVTVTWPRMAPLNPVHATTSFHVPGGFESLATGSLLVSVSDQTGAPAAGVPVQITPSGTSSGSSSSASTNANGCAFFPFQQPGTFTVSLSSPSGYTYVDPNGNATPQQDATVSVQSTSQVQFTYAQASTLDLSVNGSTDLSGLSIPFGLGISAGSSSLPGDETRYFGTQPLTNIFPSSSGYQTWLGSCYNYTNFPGTGLAPNTAVAPGSTVQIPLIATPISVTVTSSGQPVPQATVTLEETASDGSPNTNCAMSAGPVTVGTTNSSGQLSFYAPVGYVVIGVQSSSGTIQYPSTGSLNTTSGTAENVQIAL